MPPIPDDRRSRQVAWDVFQLSLGITPSDKGPLYDSFQSALDVYRSQESIRISINESIEKTRAHLSGSKDIIIRDRIETGEL